VYNPSVKTGTLSNRKLKNYYHLQQIFIDKLIKHMHYTLQQNSWCKNQQIDFNNDTATTPSKTTKIRVYK